MKKILLLIIFLIPLSGCSINKKNDIGKTINLDMKSCNIIEQKDTHGGFLGDGDYYAKIKCNNFSLTSEWNELPLSNNIKEIMNMEQCDDKGCHNVYDKYNIPNISNGYYYFIDRYNMSHDDTDLNSRGSYNFSLAIYDINTNFIYYYELDT